ncbi:hypothetical protein BX600DRAFT_459708 [Xylariales sp. PMI_506]|nr:hypothetical protein BX600DRAFT_459708 [Xylariales sp. PMI_506]
MAKWIILALFASTASQSLVLLLQIWTHCWRPMEEGEEMPTQSSSVCMPDSFLEFNLTALYKSTPSHVDNI